jgi:hypothetical protein
VGPLTTTNLIFEVWELGKLTTYPLLGRGEKEKKEIKTRKSMYLFR